MMRAPASSAAAMVAALRVSTEMTAPFAASAAMTGGDAGDFLCRRDEGGVRARALAADVENIRAGVQHGAARRDGGCRRVAWRPPSEKESGVTLRMPMTRGRSSENPAQCSGG